MNAAATTLTAEQLAERVRQMIWDDVTSGRVPTDLPSFAALTRYVDPDDYLTRAGLRIRGAGAADTARAEHVVRAVDQWIRDHQLRYCYGAFTAEDVAMLTHFVGAAEKQQDDVEIIARLAGEWLAGLHSTMSTEEHRDAYGRALLALAHDVLDR